MTSAPRFSPRQFEHPPPPLSPLTAHESRYYSVCLFGLEYCPSRFSESFAAVALVSPLPPGTRLLLELLYVIHDHLCTHTEENIVRRKKKKCPARVIEPNPSASLPVCGVRGHISEHHHRRLNLDGDDDDDDDDNPGTCNGWTGSLLFAITTQNDFNRPLITSWSSILSGS